MAFEFTSGMTKRNRGDEALRIADITDPQERADAAKEYIEGYAKFILNNGFGGQAIGNLGTARKYAIGSTWEVMCYILGNADIKQAAKDTFGITEEITEFVRRESGAGKQAALERGLVYAVKREFGGRW